MATKMAEISEVIGIATNTKILSCLAKCLLDYRVSVTSTSKNIACQGFRSQLQPPGLHPSLRLDLPAKLVDGDRQLGRRMTIAKDISDLPVPVHNAVLSYIKRIKGDQRVKRSGWEFCRNRGTDCHCHEGIGPEGSGRSDRGA